MTGTEGLWRLLTWRQRRIVARRPIITSCDLTYAGHLAHRRGICKPHGEAK